MAVALLAVLAAPLGGQDVPVGRLSLEELLEVRVRVGTGSPQTLSEVPAVVSVFTAEQIEAMGATELAEVLELVPGLHRIPDSTRSLDPALAIRGLNLDGAQALLLIDGLPVPQLLLGGPPVGFRLPAVAIERIEVIRGPGSAIYGADAFAGVVNVVTKTGRATRGGRAGVEAGSFGHRNVWAEVGASPGGWSFYAAADWREEDGDPDRIVASDLQTVLDAAFGTSASRAPGPLSTGYERVDLRLALSNPRWTLRLWGASGELGSGVGGAPVLDPTARFESDLGRFEVVRTDRPGDHWELSHRVHLYRLESGPRYRLFPPGAVLPIGEDGNVDFADPVALVDFPDGMIGRPRAEQTVYGWDSVALYRGWEGHRLRVAAGVVRQEADTSESKNFGPGVLDPLQAEDPQVTDVTGTPFIFVQDHDRDHVHLSIQDQWRLAPAWELTAGVRWDDYSDFGETVEPRVALVWSPRQEATAKLLYGSAFRGPSFGQQFGINGPQLGNPDLGPETIDMLEVVVDLRPVPGVRGVLSVFAYQARDLITQVPLAGQEGISIAANGGDQDAHGAELEVVWEPAPRVRLEAQLAWVDGERDGGEELWDYPDLQALAAVDWRVADRWRSRLEGRWLSDRSRGPGDPRPSLDGYTAVDLTVRGRAVVGRLDARLAVRNLFDEAAFEPTGPSLPGDLPLPGRSVRAGLALAW